jgi:hypothetical protein
MQFLINESTKKSTKSLFKTNDKHIHFFIFTHTSRSNKKGSEDFGSRNLIYLESLLSNARFMSLLFGIAFIFTREFSTNPKMIHFSNHDYSS